MGEVGLAYKLLCDYDYNCECACMDSYGKDPIDYWIYILMITKLNGGK